MPAAVAAAAGAAPVLGPRPAFAATLALRPALALPALTLLPGCRRRRASSPAAVWLPDSAGGDLATPFGELVGGGVGRLGGGVLAGRAPAACRRPRAAPAAPGRSTLAERRGRLRQLVGEGASTAASCSARAARSSASAACSAGVSESRSSASWAVAEAAPAEIAALQRRGQRLSTASPAPSGLAGVGQRLAQLLAVVAGADIA